MVGEGLSGVLSRFGMNVVGVVATGRQALELFSQFRPAVILLDVRLPDQSGLDVLRQMLKLDPKARVVMLTSSQADASIYDAITSGASEGATLVEQIRLVAEGGKVISPKASERFISYASSKKLSDRELEVLRLIALGQSNKEIAQRLEVSVDTIKMHVKNLLQKLQASDRTQAVVIAIGRGLIQY